MKSLFRLFIIQLSILLLGCSSVHDESGLLTKQVIYSIYRGDIQEFQKFMDTDRFNKHRKSNEDVFTEANRLMIATYNKPNFVKYELLVDSIKPLVEVKILLYNGFDSSSGLTSATLSLIYIPKNSHSKKMQLSTFYLDKKYDRDYTNYLIESHRLHSVLDSLKGPIDTALENEQKKIEVFE